MSNAPRKTSMRDRHRSVIRRRQDPCSICGREIDYSLPYLHPLEFVVDHVIPLARGGADVIENAAAAHRRCNRAKSDKMPGSLVAKPLAPMTTTRSWGGV